jgi:protein-disulfide isomerase
MTAEAINSCLSDLGNIEKLQTTTNEGATKYQITGTPTFLLNGQVVQNATTWPLIRERLRAAGAR